MPFCEYPVLALKTANEHKPTIHGGDSMKTRTILLAASVAAVLTAMSVSAQQPVPPTSRGTRRLPGRLTSAAPTHLSCDKGDSP